MEAKGKLAVQSKGSDELWSWRLRMSYHVANDVVRNRIVISNVVQEMTKGGIEQLNWRCDGFPS
jgi:hypothetical protein